MKLDPGDVGILIQAIEDSFDPFGLARLLQTRLGLNFFSVTGAYKNLGDQAVDVHNWFNHRNETEKLVAALRDARPAVAAFSHLSDRLGFATLPPASALEGLIRKSGQPYQDPGTFRTELARREGMVCKVETSTVSGTGILVGRGMVLTNHHVIAEAVDAAGAIGGTSCLFDNRTIQGGYSTPGVSVRVAGVLASSPPAPDDGRVGGDNRDVSKLDYALLKLERDIDSEPIVEEGDKRGFVTIAANPATPAVAAGLLVLQHPRGQPIKVDIGAVLWRGSTRFRHSVNTEPGSSGAPVFDAGLNLVALHHVGHDWPSTACPYNQAIPLALIVADIRARGIGL